METRCSWCGAEKVDGEWKACNRPKAPGTSDGICPTCLETYFPKQAKAISPRR